MTTRGEIVRRSDVVTSSAIICDPSLGCPQTVVPLSAHTYLHESERKTVVQVNALGSRGETVPEAVCGCACCSVPQDYRFISPRLILSESVDCSIVERAASTHALILYWFFRGGTIRMRLLRNSCEFVIALLLLGMSDSVRAAPPVPPEKNEEQQERWTIKNRSDSSDKAPSTNNKKPHISLSESIEITRKSLRDPEVEKVRRQYWKDTFDDIRKLANGRSDLSDANYRRASFLNQWKALSSPGTTAGGVDGGAPSDTAAVSNATTTSLSQNPSASKQQLQPSKRPRPQRFDGFPSWERMLADWQEEIQEYMDQASEDSEGGYLLSNYGRAPTREKTEKPTGLDEKEHVSVVSPTPPPKLPAITTTTRRRRNENYPCPFPLPQNRVKPCSRTRTLPTNPNACSLSRPRPCLGEQERP